METTKLNNVKIVSVDITPTNNYTGNEIEITFRFTSEAQSKEMLGNLVKYILPDINTQIRTIDEKPYKYSLTIESGEKT